MLNILLRTLILYLVALFIIRVMGKGDLSRMDPFQIVVLFMIAELASLPIETPEISVFSGVTALLTLLLLDVIISYLALKIPAVKRVVTGKASILVRKGEINEKEMKRLRISMDDLAEQLRLKNFPSIADVDYAILESNGDLSVIPKPGKSPATKKDLGIKPGKEGLPLIVIADGRLYQSNLEQLMIDETFIRSQLSAKGIKDYSEVFLCFSDEKGQIHVYPKAGGSNGKETGSKGWDIL